MHPALGGELVSVSVRLSPAVVTTGTLRLYGSEVVLCRLTGAAGKVRLHLINYGGRDVEGLRIRLRGAYRGQDAQVSGVGRVTLQDLIVADGATEFSLPRLTTYAVIDLDAAR